MARLTESAFKNLAHEHGYEFDGSHWVHSSGARLSTDEMANLISKSSLSNKVNDLINRKRGRTWEPGILGSDPDMRRPDEESKASTE